MSSMSATVNVTSFRALEELEIAVARFSGRARECISTALRQIEVQIEALDDIATIRRRELEEWQDAYEIADDEDDSDYVLRRLQEAEEKYNDACRWQRRVAEVCADFTRRANEAAYVVDEHSDQARLFLKARLRELHEYAALKSNADAGASDGLHHGTTEATSASPDLSDLTALSLPKGFAWIPVTQLAPDDLASLPKDNDYTKDDLSAADMRHGLELLRTRILPEIQQNPEHANREYFAELDVIENRSVATSLGEIFGAYFGPNNHIWVDRFKGDAFFRIGNGRHRIAAARELGWTAIPGRIDEANR